MAITVRYGNSTVNVVHSPSSRFSMFAMIYVDTKEVAITRATEREAMVIAMRSLQETTWDDFIKDKGIMSKPGDYRAWLQENHDKLEEGTIAALGNDPLLLTDFGRDAVKYTQMQRHVSQEITKIMLDARPVPFHCRGEGVFVLLREIPPGQISARSEVQRCMVRNTK